MKIGIFPYLRDHVFEGNAVFPAVESMGLLSGAVRALRAGLDGSRLTRAAFGKFLILSPEEDAIDARVIFEKTGDGGIQAKLETRLRIPGSGISRVKEHARACFFPGRVPAPPEAPGFMEPETDMMVSPGALYGELVPFGPAYQNISGPLRLARAAAAAPIRAPESSRACGPAGSPFVLDAAFHAACVWGQRYSGFTGFPVGLESRIVMEPTKPGGTYTAHVVPVAEAPGENIFDLWICAVPGGEVVEIVRGLRMRDVSGGRMDPPAWIRPHASGG